MRLLLTAIIGFLLAGCMSVQQSALTPVAGKHAFNPSTRFVGKVDGTTLRIASVRTLMPGRYVPVGRNNQGVWYVGTAESLWVYYPETKRGDGKHLLESFTGGVVLADNPDDSLMFYIPSTHKMYLVAAQDDAEKLMNSGALASFAPVGITTGGSIQSAAVSDAGGSPVGAAIGGTVADALMQYDAKGLRPLPKLDIDSKLRAWLVSN